MGIENHKALESHFAKGALFENLILVEYLKKQYNQGRNPNCYFWRDKLGHEIDIILERDSKLFPIEIKSGKTINTDYFKNINYFNMISNINNSSYLIYDGNEEPRSGTKIFNWQNIESLWIDTETSY